MFRSATGIAATLALLSATQAAAAAPAPACMTQPELRGMVAYILPSTMDALIERCRPGLSSNAAMLTSGPRLVGELQAGQTAAFPIARQAFSKFSGSDDKAAGELFMTMPESMLKPIIEEAMSKELVSNIKVTDCRDIDQVFATLQPLPASNFVELFTQVFSIAARNDRKMPVCAD